MKGKLTVYDIKGAPAGEVDVPESFLEVRNGRQAVQEAVTAHLARCRAGTASTLSKSNVAGSNKKPWRQKGTGQARAGLRQSPVWRGGAVAFGPHPRSYGLKLNRKVAQLAFRRVLSDKIGAGEVVLVDKLVLNGSKTREFAGILKALKVRKPVLVLLGDPDKAVSLASRNIPGVETMSAKDAGMFEILKCFRMVVTMDGWDVLKERFLAGNRE